MMFYHKKIAVCGPFLIREVIVREKECGYEKMEVHFRPPQLANSPQNHQATKYLIVSR